MKVRVLHPSAPGARTSPCQFKHRAIGAWLRTADGARGHHIPRTDVATIDSVMRQLLCHAPVHMSKIESQMRDAGHPRDEIHFQPNVHILAPCCCGKEEQQAPEGGFDRNCFQHPE